MYYSMVGTTVFYFIRNYLKLKRELLYGFCLQFNQTYGLEYAISKKEDGKYAFRVRNTAHAHSYLIEI
jgi:hypothetical protein